MYESKLYALYENDKGDKFKQYIPNEYWEEWWWFEVHKASVEELIEHHIINE